MKRIILCLAAILLLFTACKKTCLQKHPKDIKPIDWENYNDVYTVNWNYKTVSSETNTKIEQDRDKDIMICGWIFQGHAGYSVNPRKFILINKEENIFEPNSSTNNGTGIYIETYPYYSDTNNNFLDSLKIKFATTDITKKCFIKGKLSSMGLPTNYCTWIEPKIIITDIDDIYFE